MSESEDSAKRLRDRVRGWRLRFWHHHHILHRSEQFCHVALYGALAAGLKEAYVVMGGVVAVVIAVFIFADVNEIEED